MNRRIESVHQGDDGKWYFWDETWSDRYGPYESEQEATEAMYRYIHEFLDPVK